MTTICASRLHGEMAADTQVNFGSSTFPSKKIFAFGSRLAGAAGTSIACSAFMAWVEGGLDPDERPELDDAEDFQALVLSHEGLFFFEADCCPVRIERDFHAIGTGGEAALAAFMCGKTPKRAVEIAAKIDSGTGGPVTVLKLEEN